MKPLYTWKQLMENQAILKTHGLSISNQYGMLFLLNEDGKMVLRIDPLVSEEERMEHA